MPGYNNWLKTNFKLGLDNGKLPFELNLSVPSTINYNFEESSDEAANLIANKYDNLYLCLSGGMDSEFVAQVLLRNKISFTPVLLRTESNTDELWYAKNFCKRNSLTPLIIDYSTQHNKLLHTLMKYSNAAKIGASIAFYPHVIADHIKSKQGSLITGYGEPFCNSNDYDVVTEDELEITAYDYYLPINFQDQHPGAFMSYTPNMFFSLIKNMPLGINIQAAKEKLYQIPGRTKIRGELKFPDYVPRSAVAKSYEWIKTARTEILSLAATQPDIKLSSYKNR